MGMGAAENIRTNRGGKTKVLCQALWIQLRNQGGAFPQKFENQCSVCFSVKF